EQEDFDSFKNFMHRIPYDSHFRFLDPSITRLYIKSPIGTNTNKPFHTREIISDEKKYGYGEEYFFVNSSETEFKIVIEDIYRHIRNIPLKYKDQVNYFLKGQKSIKSDYDFADMLIEKANWLFDSEFVSASLFDSSDIPKLHSSHFYVNGPELRQKYFDLENKYFWIAGADGYDVDLELANDGLGGDLDDWYEENGDSELIQFDAFYSGNEQPIGEVCNKIIRELMKPKYEYYQTLISKYRKIYEQGILDFVKFISGIAFQSNVVYGVERT